ncbi:MAG TPA: zf-HC2 domain-containing protein [Candidatus Sulfotelmatobacter sp.]|nr:zf-HC2 domain-containing protein [Candidatus Sulfotelmatobacter sp.]
MVNQSPINCEQVWREISNYVEGDLDAGLRTAMDVHFRSCPRCKSVLEGTRNVVRLYGDERMIEVPAGFGQRLKRRLTRSGRVRSNWATWSSWMIPVAAMLLMAGGLRMASSRTIAHPLLSAHAQPGHGVPAEMVVVVSTGAKEFHAPGCPFIHNKDKERTLTAKEAQREGYVPCVRCMRKYLQTADARVGVQELESEAHAEGEDGEGAR